VAAGGIISKKAGQGALGLSTAVPAGRTSTGLSLFPQKTSIRLAERARERIAFPPCFRHFVAIWEA
jgi:hypothetical protein